MESTAGVGVRDLTVLGEFKPFGLVSEALDGKPPDGGDYQYFLFDPRSLSSASSGGDHELFVRGNRAIWSSGYRVQRIFACLDTILMACWCPMGLPQPEPHLCVLQPGTLSLYTAATGETFSIPLTQAIASIWPLPFGLLLQKSAINGPSIPLPYVSPASSRNARDSPWRARDHIFGHNIPYGITRREDPCTVSSHLILQHSLEEPRPILFEERGKLSPINDSNERTIWTSEVTPMLVTYHRGRMMHSVWIIEATTQDSHVEEVSMCKDLCDPFLERYSLRRIWQGKCSQIAAKKVFLSTDGGGMPVICFLLQEQRNLLSVRLDVEEGSSEVSFDARPQMSWVIPAIDAAPLAVTCSGTTVGVIPFRDVLVLTSDNNLLLYTGNQCLCRYVLPSAVLRGLVSQSNDVFGGCSRSHTIRVVELRDAVQGRINLVLSSGEIYRCALPGNTPSSLVDDCVNVMSLGLHPTFYNAFCKRFWGQHPSHARSFSDCNWELFVDVIAKMCKTYRPARPKLPSSTSSSCATSWDYLLQSKFHASYRKHAFISRSMNSTPSAENVNQSVSRICGEECDDGLSSSQFLTETLDALHALYESLKFNTLRKLDIEELGGLLLDIAASLGETSYVDYYIRDFPCLSDNIQSYPSLEHPRNPPCIFRWLENCLKYGHISADIADLPSLIAKERSSALGWARKIVSFFHILFGAEVVHNKLSSYIPCAIAKGTRNNAEESTILAMVAEGFGLQQVDLLPAGVALPLRHALDKCRESPPTDWPATAYALIGREDLTLARLGSLNSKEQIAEATKRLTSLSIPYKLHLRPVSVPSSTSDVEKMNIVKLEDSESFNTHLVDGMEHIFNPSMQLRFGRDLRLNEVRRLLCSAKPVAVHTASNPGATDQELQQQQLWNLAQRTTALPLGRGAFTLATSYALLTEALVVPKLVLAGRLPAQQNATVNLDPSVRNITDLRSWPEFHNGVAAGLRLAPFHGKISKSWIRYNRPEQPNDVHAGVLLALGLQGHLRVLLSTDIVGYLEQQHDISTVGVLLGVAASHRGTMDPSISKTLHLHIPSRFSSSFVESELTLTQSAALMALGLLYEGSGHPSTMKDLMGEIACRSTGDNVPEREGHALSAGAALGLVALGRGNDAFRFNGNFVDRLVQYIGGGEDYGERSLKSGQLSNDQNQGSGQVMDGAPFHVDVTAPGATISLALIYLKTESEVMAAKLSIPTTYFGLQYVRPDFLMLRVIARNLIMWSTIHPSQDWVESQIPEIIKVCVSMHDYEKEDNSNIDLETLVQAYVNIIAGASICIGLRYAGTGNAEAHDLLYGYALGFLNESKSISGTSQNLLPKGLLHYVDRATLEQCLHLIVLALSVVMAGSGHLRTFRFLRYLRNRSSAEGHINYGIQMAVSLAIGFLFLGGGTQTFSTRNSAVAALLITLYPRLPTGPNDNRCHLQAFRHFYVIAVESRLLQTVDVDTGLPVYAPVEVTIKETERYTETTFSQITPFNLPERASLKTVRVCGPRYWPQVIELMPEDKSWWTSGDKYHPFNGGVLYVKRKVGVSSYVEDPIGCQSLLSQALHKVTGSFECSTRSACCTKEPTISKIEQLVSNFSDDPSLISFAKLFCDSSANRLDSNFQEFCSQVIFECVSKDSSTLLQVYLTMYANIGLMGLQVQSVHGSLRDSLFLLDLKVAVAYKEAVISGRLMRNDRGIFQTTFIESLRERVDGILQCFQMFRPVFLSYLETGRWPANEDKGLAVLLSWYLQWYDIPPSHSVISALRKLEGRVSVIPFLHLLLPRTHVKALADISSLRNSLSI